MGRACLQVCLAANDNLELPIGTCVPSGQPGCQCKAWVAKWHTRAIKSAPLPMEAPHVPTCGLVADGKVNME
jgi:hypothetical protein